MAKHHVDNEGRNEANSSARRLHLALLEAAGELQPNSVVTVLEPAGIYNGAGVANMCDDVVLEGLEPKPIDHDLGWPDYIQKSIEITNEKI